MRTTRSVARELKISVTKLNNILARGLVPAPTVEFGRRFWRHRDVHRIQQYLEAEREARQGQVQCKDGIDVKEVNANTEF